MPEVQRLDGGEALQDAGPPATGMGPLNPESTLEAASAAQLRAQDRRHARLLDALVPGTEWSRLRIEEADIRLHRLDWRRLVDVGRGVFFHQFTTAEGLGNNLAGMDSAAGDKPRPNFRRFQHGEFGAPETTTCISCHWKGGEHGAGDRTDNAYLLGDGQSLSSHDERNPPSLLGQGWIQLVAEEMNADLAAQRLIALDESATSDQSVTVDLVAKGISFGRLRVFPDGSEDATLVTGVDADLVIKPFGWKGVWPNIRRFVEGSLQLHMGMQSDNLVRQGMPERVGRGPHPKDPDNDGVEREVTDGQISAVEAYIATLETGAVLVPPAPETQFAWQRGDELFGAMGCRECHVPYVELDSSIYRIRSDVTGETLMELDLATMGAEPRPSRDPLSGKLRVAMFSDLRRHGMGEGLQGPNVERGVARTHYMTPRLWGLARSSPYLYDGRAATFDEAIAQHGEEGAEAADAFNRLGFHDKAAVRVFLLSLTRKPAALVR